MCLSTLSSHSLQGDVLKQQPQQCTKSKSLKIIHHLENYMNKTKDLYILYYFYSFLLCFSLFPLNTFPGNCFSVPWGPFFGVVPALPPTSHCFGFTVVFLVTPHDFKVALTLYHLSTFLTNSVSLWSLSEQLATAQQA